jgi:hypothetical protein
MWPFLKRYGVSAALIAVGWGFDVSDIHSQILPYMFWGFGALFLIPPALGELKKITIIPASMNPTPGKTDFDRRMKALLLGIVLLLLASCIGLIYILTRPQPHPLHDLPLRQIHAVKFAHEDVKVDGNSFFDCTFDNVTFIYNGTTHFDIERPKIIGIVKITHKSVI